VHSLLRGHVVTQEARRVAPLFVVLRVFCQLPDSRVDLFVKRPLLGNEFVVKSPRDARPPRGGGNK
jgi:hypothetical protein